MDLRADVARDGAAAGRARWRRALGACLASRAGRGGRLRRANGVCRAPVFMAIARNATIYDGIRHLLFIVPPVTIAGGRRLACRPRCAAPARQGGAVLLALGLAEPLVFQIRNHPEPDRLLQPARGRPARRVRAATTWITGRTACCRRCSGRPSSPSAAACRSASPAIRRRRSKLTPARYRSVWFAPRDSPDFHMDIRLLRGPRDSVREFAAREDVLYRVTTADGTPLCVVLPGPAFHRDQSGSGSIRRCQNGGGVPDYCAAA